MADLTDLDGFDIDAAMLQKEWMITIDTPDAGIPDLLTELETHVSLRQGSYDCCSFIQRGGQQRFRCLEGSHAGAEGVVRQTSAAQIIFSIPQDTRLLRRVFNSIFKAHVNEEPTIRVQPVFGSRSKMIDDKDNPNRYWNRSDAGTLHGNITGRDS